VTIRRANPPQIQDSADSRRFSIGVSFSLMTLIIVVISLLSVSR
jgi:hypothetical protein